MKIPKRFNLFAQTTTIEYDEQLHFRENCSGEARYRTNRILLQPSTDQHPRIQSQIEQTFCHELVHHILHAQNKHALRDDEEFVDTFAALLHQALTTMEYDDEP